MTGGVRAHPFKIDVLQNRDLSVIVAEASEHIIKGWPIIKVILRMKRLICCMSPESNFFTITT